MLKEIRKEKGMTQQELGDRSGISPKLIARYECGDCNPKNMTLERGIKLADALGVHPRKLIEE